MFETYVRLLCFRFVERCSINLLIASNVPTEGPLQKIVL